MSGKVNQRRGKSFEELCYRRSEKIAPNLTVKHIDRTRRRGTSLPDLEFNDFPEFIIDCKHTVEEFTWNDLKKLFRVAKKKYCKVPGYKMILITGEWKGKGRINWNDVNVVTSSTYGLVKMLYDDWLLFLDKELQNG